MMKWKCLWCLIFLGSWEISSLGNGKLSIKVGSGASGLKEFQRTNRPQRSTLFSTFSKQFLHIRKWTPMVGCLYPSNRFMFFPHSIHFLFFSWWSSSDWFIGASPFFSTISLIQFFFLHCSESRDGSGVSIHKGDYYEENNILLTSLSFQGFFLLSILLFVRCCVYFLGEKIH